MGGGVWVVAKHKKTGDRVPNALSGKEGRNQAAFLLWLYQCKKAAAFRKASTRETRKGDHRFLALRANKPRQDPFTSMKKF